MQGISVSIFESLLVHTQFSLVQHTTPNVLKTQGGLRLLEIYYRNYKQRKMLIANSDPEQISQQC